MQASIFSLLTVLFVGLKLTHQIDWGWLWVVSPLWLPLALFLGFLAVFSVVGVFVLTVAAMFEKKK